MRGVWLSRVPNRTMEKSDHRQIGRESMFVMADLLAAGLDGEHRIKVRNLSAGGMMGEGPVSVVRGTAVSVNLGNLGWIEGSVAWVQENRFGVAFHDEIDPGSVGAPDGSKAGADLSLAHQAPKAPGKRAGLPKV
jgi:hypothetical protein